MITLGCLCYFCQQQLALTHHAICSICLPQIASLPICCPGCGLPAKQATKLCRRCALAPPLWQRLIAVSDYHAPLKDLIIAIKYYRRTEWIPLLGRLLLLKWLTLRHNEGVRKPDLLLPIPLHHSRQWQRGFNHSELLARYLAHYLGCRYDPKIIQKCRATRPQQDLSASQRRVNLDNAFKLTDTVADRHIVLIDDVMTTGSTFKTLTELLLLHGARCVEVWCICRTLGDK